MGFFFDQKSRPTVRTISIHRRAASATYGLRPKVEELRSSTLRSRACGVWGRWRWWTAQHGTSHTRDDRVAKRSRRTVATVEGVLRMIHGYVPATTTLRVRGRSSGVITTSSPHTLPTHRAVVNRECVIPISTFCYNGVRSISLFQVTCRALNCYLSRFYHP